MDASQTSETFGCNARPSEVRHLDLLRVADHDVFDLTLSVDEHADLTSRLERDLGHLSRKLLRDYLCGWNASRGKTLDATKLVMFKALREPSDVTDKP